MKHFSLCSGIGGLDLAAEWAGFETIAQCEIDEYASRVLTKNFKGVPNLHDIRTVTNERLAELGIDVGGITVISAGFPCQPYSLAGKGRGDRDSRDLWGEVARVLGEVKPPWFVGENTPGLFARQNHRFFRRVLDDLASLGYTVGWGIWGACDVGAQHRRKRVFLLGWNSNDLYDKKERSIQRGKNTESRRTCGDISDSNGMWKLQQEGGIKDIGEWACDLRENVPDAAGYTERGLSCGKEKTQSLFGIGCRYAGAEWWQTEPDVGRVVDELPHRVDRLRCLGNAVVPAQAYPIFKAIADFYGGQNGKGKRD